VHTFPVFGKLGFSYGPSHGLPSAPFKKPFLNFFGIEKNSFAELEMWNFPGHGLFVDQGPGDMKLGGDFRKRHDLFGEHMPLLEFAP
jgi:hypothetical protein